MPSALRACACYRWLIDAPVTRMANVILPGRALAASMQSVRVGNRYCHAPDATGARKRGNGGCRNWLMDLMAGVSRSAARLGHSARLGGAMAADWWEIYGSR